MNQTLQFLLGLFLVWYPIGIWITAPWMGFTCSVQHAEKKFLRILFTANIVKKKKKKKNNNNNPHDTMFCHLLLGLSVEKISYKGLDCTHTYPLGSYFAFHSFHSVPTPSLSFHMFLWLIDPHTVMAKWSTAYFFYYFFPSKSLLLSSLCIYKNFKHILGYILYPPAS